MPTGFYKRKPVTIERKFWKKVRMGTPSKCWIWTGYVNEFGYGRIRLTKEKRNISAHRLSLQLHGVRLLPGKYVDHMCMNKACVNPNHLRQVTPRKNFFENTRHEGVATYWAKRKRPTPRVEP